MKIMKRCILRVLAASAILVSVGLAPSAYASHFRGGNMSATIDANGVVTITSETRWRKGGSPGSVFPLGGISRNALIEGAFPSGLQVLDGTTRAVLASTSVFGIGVPLANPSIVGTTVSTDFSDPAFDIRRQQFSIDLPALGLGQGLYIIYWTDAARIPGLHNVTEVLFPPVPDPFAAFSLELCVLFDETPRSTPSIVSSVITTVAQGQLYSNNLNATGDSALSYSFIVGSSAPRYGPTTQIPGLTLDSTGQVEIPAVDTATLNDINLAGEPAGDYVFKVLITDADGQYIEQDVMLDVVVTPNEICTIIVSDSNPTVFVGQILELTITADDPDGLDVLTITDFSMIPNSSLSQSGSNPAVATYTFTPDESQGDTTIGVNFIATDDGSPPLECVVNVQIEVIGNRPPEITCNDPVVLWSPNHDLFDVSSAFSVVDPDGDPVTLSVRVFSDETETPETGDGTGRHAPDFKEELFEGGRGLIVRSERRGPADGRVYIFVITASDGIAETTEVCIAAVVPHDQNDESLVDVLAQAAIAWADVLAAVLAPEPLPPSGLVEHGLSEELGPKQ